MTRPSGLGTVALAVALAGAARASAQDAQPPAAAAEAGTSLTDTMRAMAERRLLTAEGGSVERMRALVRTGENLFLDERYDEAALRLFEVVESPRYADFVDLPEVRGAEYMLARALERLGALRTAGRYLDRILARGGDEPYFGPAYRKRVDVALGSGDLAAGVAALEALGTEGLPEDALNELRYLRGRARYDAVDHAAAETVLAEITRRSRFYASAQYLRGAMAARRGALDEAEGLFCSIATQGDQDRFTFYVDERYFEVKDLARLALGRVAHEGQRADDAFYYYFQVPQDSERVPEALFEAAYAMYEGGDLETSIDLLDQLDARFPESPFVDEATLLRGYVHLGRCEFDEADRLFRRFATTFEPVVAEIARVLAAPARQQRLYEELLASQDAPVRDASLPGDDDDAPADRRTTVQRLVLAMLRVDPAFYRLHGDVRTLDAESGRAGRLSQDLAQILGRVRGGDAPRAAAAPDASWDEAADLERDLGAARAVLRGLAEQLDAMRREPQARDDVRAVETDLARIGARVEALSASLTEARRTAAATAAAPDEGTDLAALLRRDVEHARRLPARVADVRARLASAANEQAVRALRTLHARLSGELRRARIGRIDAVMGSKRRIEIQIESLAAGRFPPELRDPLRVQGLLRDDEEYWPFEGELWQDEMQQADDVPDIAEE